MRVRIELSGHVTRANDDFIRDAIVTARNTFGLDKMSPCRARIGFDSSADFVCTGEPYEYVELYIEFMYSDGHSDKDSFFVYGWRASDMRRA